MSKNSPKKSAPPPDSVGASPVTREMVQARARACALAAGRAPPQVAQIDYERAKRELTGSSDWARQEAMLDSIPAAKRHEPVPDSSGGSVPESPSEDEDDEGRGETEQLVDLGVEEAAKDQMRQAARTAKEQDQVEP